MRLGPRCCLGPLGPLSSAAVPPPFLIEKGLEGSAGEGLCAPGNRGARPPPHPPCASEKQACLAAPELNQAPASGKEAAVFLSLSLAATSGVSATVFRLWRPIMEVEGGELGPAASLACFLRRWEPMRAAGPQPRHLGRSPRTWRCRRSLAMPGPPDGVRAQPVGNKGGPLPGGQGARWSRTAELLPCHGNSPAEASLSWGPWLHQAGGPLGAPAAL